MADPFPPSVQEDIRWSRRFRELPRPDHGQAVLTLAGEIILSGTMYASAPLATRTLFGLLHDSDVAFGVLSQALSDWGAPARKDVIIGPTEVALDLAGAGLGVVSVATNHGGDAGADGVVETLAALERSGVVAVGGGRSEAAAWTPVRREVRGRRLGFLGIHTYRGGVPGMGSPGASGEAPGAAVLEARRVRVALERGSAGVRVPEPELVRVERAVREASSGNDVVVVALNARWADPGGYDELVPDGLRQLARAAVASGADLVLGSGRHRMLPLERHQGGLIAYGLGSLFFQLFDAEGAPARRYTVFPETLRKLGHFPGRPEYFRSVVLRSLVSGHGIARVDAVPFVLSPGGTPSMPSDPEADEVLDRWLELAAPAGLSFQRDAWHAWALLEEEGT